MAFRNTDGTALEMWGGVILLIIVTLIKLIIQLLIIVIMLTIRMNGSSNVEKPFTKLVPATIMIGDAGLAEYNNLYDTSFTK